MDALDKTTLGFLSIAMVFLIIVVGMLNNKVTLMHEEFHTNMSVTPAQLDSALVEASYWLLAERDSVIRECVKRLGPLDPECRP